MAFFVCPSCFHVNPEWPDEQIGKTVKCVKCQTEGEVTEYKHVPEQPPEPPTAAKQTAIIWLLVAILVVLIFQLLHAFSS